MGVVKTARLPPVRHAAIPHSRIGVLLVNLGTPEGTDFYSMRRYLKEFLSDKRVIEWPKMIWYPILYGIVLNTRPQKSGRYYKRIWNKEKNESPLRTYTRLQAEKLTNAFDTHIIIDWAMRYGQPAIETRLTRMCDRGCQRIILFPLYPQYSAATTATVNDKFFKTLMKMRFMPAVRTVPSYQNEPIYIQTLSGFIKKHLAILDFEPDVILASYHGIPKSYSEKGDPYYHHCIETSHLLRTQLGFDEKKFITTFQSRFGPEEWLQPYTDKTIERLAKEGIKAIAVVNPGFVSDCLETLDEIGNEAVKIFYKHGGLHFTHIPCLNDSDEGIQVIEMLVRRELQGWI